MRSLSFKFVAAMAFLIALGLAPAFAANAKDKNKIPKDQGEVRITTSPVGFPIMIDGQSYGVSNDPADPIRLGKGSHHVEVLFPGKPWSQDVMVEGGKRNCICLTYSRKPLYSPCPYRPTVSAPDTIADGDTITFTSDVSYTGTRPLAYTWTVTPSAAKIVGSTDTNTLVVDTTGLGGQRVTASLHVNPGYGDERCTAMAEAGTDVTLIPPPPEKRNWGTSPGLSFDMDKASLDNFAIQLQNEPSNTGYLIVYGGRGNRAGSADRLAKRSLDYLVQTRGIDRNRVVVVNGGTSDTDFIEMWLVPPGAEPPVPSQGGSAPAKAPADQPADAQPDQDHAVIAKPAPQTRPRTAPRK
jgi:hypothetical protein